MSVFLCAFTQMFMRTVEMSLHCVGVFSHLGFHIHHGTTFASMPLLIILLFLLILVKGWLYHFTERLYHDRLIYHGSTNSNQVTIPLLKKLWVMYDKSATVQTSKGKYLAESYMQEESWRSERSQYAHA